ncbi:MAG TPA: DUF6152 family protein [Gammaproteobacteria bacterium]|nr:DUF6152 family protein [Gammaproteobacteria bacterium]
MAVRSGFVIAAALVAAPVAAHHGIGTFDTRQTVTLTGVVTGVDFVNPHSWLYLDVTGADGKVAAWRCEMHSATTLRRSGWSAEMFEQGKSVTITGAPDRNDPSSCYLSTVVFADGSSADRYGQLSKAPAPRAAGERAARLPSGEPNLSGDWAPEQLVMTDPRGRGGALVPLSQAQSFEPGANTPENARQYRTRDVELTPAGREKADAFETYNPQHNPRMRCETTSILFDWTYDGAVNRITQAADRITLEYGQLGFTRTIHLNMTEHPATVEPSRAGHSIARWENDVLVVDTVGFAAGVLSPPVQHTDRLHVVERFSLDPAGPTLMRSYVAEDPVYFAGTYSGSDMLAPADVPYARDECDGALTFVDYSKEGQSPTEAPAAAKPWWKFWD